MDVVGRATQEAKAEDEGRCYAAGPHPGPLGKCSRQLLRALLYLPTSMWVAGFALPPASMQSSRRERE